MKSNLQNMGKIFEQRDMAGNVSHVYRVVKRMVDIVVSMVGIVLLLPLFLLIALAIECEAFGPLFAVRKKYGYRGKILKLLEIDTARKNGWAGRFLKKTGLYKLPMLFNLFIGDLSIVGPMPTKAEDLARYSNWYILRMSVKPGMVGLWQLKRKKEIGFEEMTSLDLKYIRERSLLYDLKIVCMSISLLVRRFWNKCRVRRSVWHKQK